MRRRLALILGLLVSLTLLASPVAAATSTLP
jgi:hypothetical protein